MAKNDNVSAKKETVTEPVAVKKTATQPMYTVDEFAKAPQALGETSKDIVRAALSIDGKGSYTVEEAKKLVKEFKSKGVK